MSQYITLKKWSGDDPEEATRRLAKIFRISSARASSMMDDLSAGNEWVFEQTISDEQAPIAQMHLEKIGFRVMLQPTKSLVYPAEEPEIPSAVEELSMFTPDEKPDKLTLLKSLLNTGLSKLEKKESFQLKELQVTPGVPPSAEKPKPPFLDNLFRLIRSWKTGHTLPLLSVSGRKSWFSRMGKKSVSSVAALDEPYKQGFSKIELPVEVIPPKAKSSQLLLILLIGFLGLVAGLPYWAGMQIETRFNHLSSLFSANHFYQWINHRFDRGIFYSTAETRIRLGPSVELKMIHDISHGPLLIHDLMQGDWQEHLQWVFRDGAQAYLALASVNTQITFNPPLSPNLNPLKIQTKVSFKRNIDSRYRIDPVELQGSVPVKWGGLNGETHLPQARNALQGTFQILPLSVTFERKRVTLDGMETTFNVQRGPSKLWQGSSQFNINRAVVEDFNEPLTLNGIQTQMDSRGQQESTQSTTRIQTGELKVGNAAFGPGNLTAHVRNMDASALIRLQQFAPLGATLDPQIQQKALGILNDLAKRSPELEILEIRFTYPEGILKGQAKLRIDGTRIDLVNNPSSIFEAIQANASVNAPKIVFERGYQLNDITNPSAPPMGIQLPVQTWLKQGYLMKDGENYKTDIAFQNGQITLNGQKFNP